MVEASGGDLHAGRGGGVRAVRWLDDPGSGLDGNHRLQRVDRFDGF